MKPGLGRAVVMGTLGFLGSLLFVIVLRYLQSIEPVFDAQIALILAAFVSSFAFIWGAGGADPRVNQHPHEPEVDAETGFIIVSADEHQPIDEENDTTQPPTVFLAHSLWRTSFFIILLMVGVFAFANLSGFLLKTSGDPEASTEAVGFYTTELPILGEVVMSQLTLFVVMIIAILAILGGIAHVMGLIFISLSRNVSEVRAEQPTRLSYQTPQQAFGKPYKRDLIIALVILGLYAILFDFMVRGQMGFSTGTTIFLIILSVTIGGALFASRSQGLNGSDKLIEAIKVFSLSFSLVFLVPVLYIIHYEAAVGFIIPGDPLRTLLSLGAAFSLSPLLVFLLFNDTVSDIIIKSARKLRNNLRASLPVPATSTELVVKEEQQIIEGVE
jgi:hypothetical protein